MPMNKATIRVILPPETEEWAEELLEGGDYAPLCWRTDESFLVRYELNGNLDAIGYTQGVLRDLEEAFLEGNISPYQISILTDVEEQ